MSERHWDGKTVHVARAPGPGHDPRRLEIGLTEGTARELALSLRRLFQTTMMVPPSVRELADALDYVLVGDPASRNTYRAIRESMGTFDEAARREFHRSPMAEPGQGDAPGGTWNAATDPRLRALRSPVPTEPGVPLGTREAWYSEPAGGSTLNIEEQD
jgi:hypothetical protein